VNANERKQESVEYSRSFAFIRGHEFLRPLIGYHSSHMSISRRRFLETAAASSLAASSALGAEGAMPTRVLGRTGQRVSILGIGCGSRLLMYKDAEKGRAALNRALDLGINYVDTAFSYGDGVSETWVGEVMKQRRKGVFLVTKVERRKGDEALKIIEGSLRRLQTDHVDLIHVHGLMDEDDLKAVEAKDGVLNALYKLRDQKVTRFIGVTCHHDPHVLRAALEHNDFDCTQMALNAARVGPTKGFHDPWNECFETIALPVARGKNMGITAMKVFGQDKLADAAPASTLIRYAMSLPIAAAIIGMPKLAFIDQNVEVAKSFTPMPEDEMRKLSRDLAAKYKLALDQFFHGHIDA
jgi:aryl-alcohol dehydrogenase-like predicted oxidoreductase